MAAGVGVNVSGDTRVIILLVFDKLDQPLEHGPIGANLELTTQPTNHSMPTSGRGRSCTEHI